MKTKENTQKNFVQPFSEYLMEHRDHIKLYLFTLIKWLFSSAIIGFGVGIIGSAFVLAITKVTSLRQDNPWLLFFLPLAGFLTVLFYRITSQRDNTGTNLVIASIQYEDSHIPAVIMPLMFICTIMTHLTGGSAGREGAALQIGGSFGNTFGRLMRFEEKDRKIMIICGMSACFSALFGTPAAAAIFSIEVVAVGIMQYSALVPAVLSAVIARYTARAMFHIPKGVYELGEIPEFNLVLFSKTLLLAACFAFASILLILALHKFDELFDITLKNDYIRAIVIGLIVIAMRYIFGTTDYLGAGGDYIAGSFTVSRPWFSFLLKILFTAITLGGGLKGGEIVPSMFVGATLGSFLAPVLGLPIGLCAACGMVSVFCGATNCPLTSLILGIEMFGDDGIYYILICVALTYMLSDYFSLYKAQRIAYSKFTPVARKIE